MSLAGVKTVGVIAMALVLVTASGQDPAGRGMAAGFAAVAGLYWLLTVLPAFILARKGRRLGLSLALLLLPEPILLVLWQVL